MEYRYLGDRFTARALRGAGCDAVRRNGKCLRGRNGSMLVRLADGQYCVVLARLLRRTDKEPAANNRQQQKN